MSMKAKYTIPSNINDLNDNYLMLIFKKVNNLSEYIKLKSVCVRWSNIIDKLLNSQQVIDFNNCFGESISDETEMDSFLDSNDCLVLLETLIKKCPNLEVFDLSGFTIYFNGCTVQPRWQFEHNGDFKMKIGHFNFNDYHLKLLAEHCKSLKVVKICWLFDTITDEGLKSLITNCPNIEYLDLDDCWHINGKYFHLLSPNLKHLKCQETTVTPDLMVQQLSKGPVKHSITTFMTGLSVGGDIGYKSNDSFDVFMQICENFYNLKHFCWDYRMRVEHSAIHIGLLSNLVTLDLRTDSASLTDTALMRIFRCCPQIKRLAIELYNEKTEFMGVTDESLKDLSVYIPQIEMLFVSSANHVTDKSVCKIIYECRLLDYIRFENCPRITNKAIFALVHVANIRPHHSIHYKFIGENLDDDELGPSNLYRLPEVHDHELVFFDD